MKANTDGLRDGNVTRGRLEGYLDRELAAIDPKTGHARVLLRLYCKQSGVNGAAIWVRGAEQYGSGGGRTPSNNASCGYHKPSEAAQRAIEDAGIVLSRPIDGRGDTAIRDAFEAIAKAVFGRRRFIVHQANN